MREIKGYTEKEVIATIHIVVNKLIKKFHFGYLTVEDMRQEGVQYAIEGLEKYDEKRPLENYLFACVHNGFYNLKRNKYERPDKPCLDCPFYDPKLLKSRNACAQFTDRSECIPFHGWSTRNTAKKNLIASSGSAKETDYSYEGYDTVVSEELFAIIDKHLDVKLRANYIKMRNNIKISKTDRKLVEEAVTAILEEHYAE